MLTIMSQSKSIPPGPDGSRLRTLESAPNFALPRNLVSDNVFSNLKYLLTAKAGRTSSQEDVILVENFRGSFIDNLREFFRPAPISTANPESSLSGTTSLGIKIESTPLYLSILRNLREYVIASKMRPLELTGEPIQVSEIWTKQRRLSGANLTSAALHASITALAVALTVHHVAAVDPVKPLTVLIAPVRTDAPDRLPPAAPPPIPRMTHIMRKSFFEQGKLSAPVAIPKIVNAKHDVEDAVAPDLNSLVASGTPAGILGGVLGGQSGGVPGGFLAGRPSSPLPPGVPITKSGVVRVGGAVKPPRCIYAPDPEYTPVARHAGVSGIVILEITIDEKGIVVNMRAIQGPPLLIGPARKAVAQWKFEPSYLDGKPISVEMEVRVSFHLLRP